MLIRQAEIHGTGLADLRLENGRIAAIGQLAPRPGEATLDALGGALIPGLHDHHLHLNALAARQASILCGPPDVTDAATLASTLGVSGSGWLRGIGYHESVMGLPQAAELDRLVPDRPLRLQHRSGRMWLLNSQALDLLLAAAKAPPGLEREGGRFTGRLFDEDAWLRAALGGQPPDLDPISASLAACGVTGLTDMSPANGLDMARQIEQQCRSGALRQRCMLAGSLALADLPSGPWQVGPAKLHLHEAALPDLDQAIAFARAAHDQGRALAIHCTTEVEMVFALALLEAAGPRGGDRIEHASIADPGHIAAMARLGLQVCVQPHFVAERGERYRIDVEARHQGDLYRLASLIAAGLPLAGGSDAPFGSADPWAAMRAAVLRQTADAQPFGAEEALSAEQALALFLADPQDLARTRQITPGAVADLCLLRLPWRAARERLLAEDVRAVWSGGEVIHHGIDQAPAERLPG